MSTRITALAALGLTAALAVTTVAASAAWADSGALPAPMLTPTPTEAPASGSAGVTVGATVAAPGDPLPVALPQLGPIFATTPAKGDPVPARTAVITATATIAAKHANRPAVTVACPGGLRVVGGYQTSTAPKHRGSWSLDGDSRGSLSSAARFEHFGRPATSPASLLLVCRRPDRTGSFLLHPRRARAGETAAHVRRGSHDLYQAPGRTYRGVVTAGQPVSIVRRSASGRWAYVITDAAGTRGWISAAAVR